MNHNYTKEFLCGCRIKIVGDLHTSAIEYCPKHKAAPDMYEALKALMKEYWMDTQPDETATNNWSNAQKALAKAEGRDNANQDNR